MGRCSGQVGRSVKPNRIGIETLPTQLHKVLDIYFMVKGQKYHILYKTTCTATGNFYIGVHSTTNLEDGYLGSGLRLYRSIKKYGIEKHTREILKFFDSREDLLKHEREVVNEDLLKEDKCMNLKRGGEGGFNNKEHMKKCSEAGIARLKELYSTNDEWKKNNFKNRSESLKRDIKAGKRKVPHFSWSEKGEKMSEEMKKNIGKASSIHQKGEGNSQFGKKWIHNEHETFAVKKELLDEYLLKGYKIGRKRYKKDTDR